MTARDAHPGSGVKDLQEAKHKQQSPEGKEDKWKSSELQFCEKRYMEYTVDTWNSMMVIRVNGAQHQDGE